MRYQIYNPSTVTFESFETLDTAIARRNELRAVAEGMFPYTFVAPAECSMLSDWQIADAFFAQKTGEQPLDFANAARIALGGVDHPTYTDSVYNLTTQEPWARTFAYSRDDKLFHIKVRNGAVTDWYEYQSAYGGVTREWVAFDLQSGAPIEYYDFNAPTLTKTNVATGEVTAAWTMGETPPQDFLDRVPVSVNRAKIFAYSTKTYGDIIEYQEEFDGSSTTAEVRNALTVVEAAGYAHAEEQRRLTKEQIVVLEEIENPDGTTSTRNIDTTV